MESKRFLENKLRELQDRFKKLSIKYQYNPYSEVHIVEILPLVEYKTNEEYIQFESDLSFEFDNSFFPESIMFVSEESLTRVDSPELTFEPSSIIEIKEEIVECSDAYDTYSFTSLSSIDYVMSTNDCELLSAA